VFLRVDADAGRTLPFKGGFHKPLRSMLLLCLALPAQGQHHFRVLHYFGNGNDGAGVWSSVTLDKAGNIYGTTSGEGLYKAGTIFRLAPSTGYWKETILHNFGSWPHDGEGPFGGVLLTASGTLYGATQVGGAYGAGTVYQLSRGLHGWREVVVYNFTNHDLACCPWGNLVEDPDGNLYGTGHSAFELSPSPKGWTETILHVFSGKNGDGQSPMAGPIRDVAGNLYGTTLHGGGSKECGDGCGTVWELSPPVSGGEASAQGWTEHILHRFGVDDTLAFPGVGQLAMDAQGNLYGAVLGGKYRAGVIYKLSPVSAASATSEWRETILYNFTGGSDGGFPEGVILDKSGNLYGICGGGVVFQLAP